MSLCVTGSFSPRPFADGPAIGWVRICWRCKMAKALKKTTTPRVKRPRKPKIVDTRESLIAELSVLLDRVDEQLPRLPNLNWRWGYGPLAKEREDTESIIERLRPLVEDEAFEDEGVEQLLFTALARPGGTVPSLARPGS